MQRTRPGDVVNSMEKIGLEILDSGQKSLGGLWSKHMDMTEAFLEQGVKLLIYFLPLFLSNRRR
jgi:hypothetical protein